MTVGVIDKLEDLIGAVHRDDVDGDATIDICRDAIAEIRRLNEIEWMYLDLRQ